jgi:hypothetical protein
MLEFADASADECQPDPRRPRVVVIRRPSEFEIRRILNENALVEAARELCSFCEVQIVEFEEMMMNDQLKFTCGTSLLIEIHGSGLIHAAWMNSSTPERPTAVVEFFPYKYNCRTWYKQCANTFGIQHFAIHTQNVNQSRWEKFHNHTKVERCHTLDDECMRGRCHDFLRDQSIYVDIQQFKEIVEPFFQSLWRARQLDNRHSDPQKTPIR